MNKTLRKWIIILVILLIPVLLVGGYILKLKKGFSRDEIGQGRGEYLEAKIEIESYDMPRAICDELKEMGIITYNQHLYDYIKETGTGSSIQVGTFTLNNTMTYEEIMEILTTSQGRVADLWATVPEGSTAIKVAEIVAESTGLCTAEEFLEVANNGDFSQYWWWSAIPTENRFMKAEGYLLPDTYNFYNDSTVYELVDRFYSEFNNFISDQELLDQLDSAGMTLDQMVVLGSMVQEEAGNSQNELVSSVFHNRLADDYLLQSNASSYIRDDADNNYVNNWMAPYYGGWNYIPEGMAEAYDTYAVAGLPAGPISCPGRDAMRAAAFPADTDYYYFVTDSDGNYYYAVTLEEHYANCRKCGYVYD